MHTNENKALTELIEDHRFDKTGDDLINSLCSFYNSQPGKGKKSLEKEFQRWITEGDLIKAGWAIVLFSKLGITTKLSFLENISKNIRDGSSPLPKYYIEFLDPAIEELKSQQ